MGGQTKKKLIKNENQGIRKLKGSLRIFSIHRQRKYNNSLYYIELDKAIAKAITYDNQPKTGKEENKQENKDIAVRLINPKDFNISGFVIQENNREGCQPSLNLLDHYLL